MPGFLLCPTGQLPVLGSILVVFLVLFLRAEVPALAFHPVPQSQEFHCCILGPSWPASCPDLCVFYLTVHGPDVTLDADLPIKTFILSLPPQESLHRRSSTLNIFSYNIYSRVLVWPHLLWFFSGSLSSCLLDFIPVREGAGDGEIKDEHHKLSAAGGWV